MIKSYHFNLVGYLLTLIGYMTLTISLPLLSHIATSFSITYAATHVGLGLLFLLFSVSAVVLSSLSDAFSVNKVIQCAQVISIVGLFVLGFSHGEISFYIGCVLVGFGTGCYSSIGRSLIAKHADSEISLKKAFSYLSLCVVVAPILASYLASYLALYTWRSAYFVMILLEVLTLVYTAIIVGQDSMSQQSSSIKNILANFKMILCNKTFLINMISTGIAIAIFMQVLMVNMQSLFVNGLKISLASYSGILLGVSIFYILGIFVFRYFVHHSHKHSMRLMILVLLLCGIFIFSLSQNSVVLSVISIYLICFSLGCVMPLITGAAMSNIQSGTGSATALLTFSFAITASAWSFLQAHLGLGVWAFMLIACWVSFGVLVICALAGKLKR